MTRKQALMRVCEILREAEQSEEYIEMQSKLQEIIMDMPFSRWSEATIFDTFDQWICEHGRIPTTKDRARKGLPPIPVIKNRFGLTGKEFIDTHYPRAHPKCDSVKYGDKYKEEWLRIFKSEFLRIRPTSAVEFNQNREQELPTWATFARFVNLSTWRQLLNYCNFAPIPKKRQPFRKEKKLLKIVSHVDILQRIDEIKINEL